MGRPFFVKTITYPQRFCFRTSRIRTLRENRLTQIVLENGGSGGWCTLYWGLQISLFEMDCVNLSLSEIEQDYFIISIFEIKICVFDALTFSLPCRLIFPAGDKIIIPRLPDESGDAR